MTSPSTVELQYIEEANWRNLGVVAVGFAGGQCKPGVDAAPQALIEAGLLDTLQDVLGYKIQTDDKHVHNYVDVLPTADPAIGGMLNPRTVSAVTQQLANQVYERAIKGHLTLTLGGDHSIAIGSIAGAARAIRERLGKAMNVIWVDAHADINTPTTSSSGNIHGMPCAFLTGIADADAPENPDTKQGVFSWLKSFQETGEPVIDARRLVYIGLRDVDIPEKNILKTFKIKAYSMHDVDRWGIGKVMEMALEYLAAVDQKTPNGSPNGEVHPQERPGGGYTYPGLGPTYLSFDVDALDPMWAPSTGTPVRGGLTLREGDFICECVHATGALVGMDLVEVNPTAPGYTHDSPGAQDTVRAGCSLVRCTFGESLL